MGFECTSCGLCCKQIRAIKSQPAPFPWMQKAVDEFPHGTRADGSCEKLEDNRCTVYADRPLLCNIDRLADEPDMPVDKETWYEMNYIGCKQLQMEIV